MKRGGNGGEDGDKGGVVRFTVCKRVQALRGDDHLSSAALVLVLPVGNLGRTMLCEGVILFLGLGNGVQYCHRGMVPGLLLSQ